MKKLFIILVTIVAISISCESPKKTPTNNGDMDSTHVNSDTTSRDTTQHR